MKCPFYCLGNFSTDVVCGAWQDTHTWARLPYAKYETWDGFPVAAVSAVGGSEELYNSSISQGTAWNLSQH